MSDFENYTPPESIWDRRRKAPFHFLSKASNARMSAYVLSHIAPEDAGEFAAEAGYSDSTGVALGEAFRRESAVALELILKAVICVETKKQPPTTHDIYDMWSKSNLPSLADDDWYRLALMTETLYWSGRYAAPRTDMQLEKPAARFEKHKRTKQMGSLKILQHIPLEWEDFARLYRIVSDHFWSLDPNSPENFVS